ncbi:MAG: hypothetical protein AEth_01940 [Candidatus Argoarchaeum ethanivorans]|uniref:Uncharacterized protein n=1 Tax=Candidatus Argoarchaeum ethanivorans TaxID=2608793 RepID=A0A8B3S125_9EURY|nr:MAG: hypothetical protein AEth_01940 [Candidatus Argoarchaeum ethanivorans]
MRKKWKDTICLSGDRSPLLICVLDQTHITFSVVVETFEINWPKLVRKLLVKKRTSLPIIGDFFEIIKYFHE